VTVIEKKLVKEEDIGEGLRSRRVLMQFQSLRGFEEEEAMEEALNRFLAAIIAELYLLEAVRRGLR